eukprot:COSAG02_NODE_4544_length_5228_cov_8.569117_4_plen_58_part_00
MSCRAFLKKITSCCYGEPGLLAEMLWRLSNLFFLKKKLCDPGLEHRLSGFSPHDSHK